MGAVASQREKCSLSLGREPTSPLRTLVRRIQQGIDVESNSQVLFHRCGRLLWFFFERRSVGRDLREDLIQETMFKVFTRIQQFRGEAHFDAWLFEIAGNVAREHSRRLRTAKRSAHVISIEEFAGSQENDRSEVLAAPEPDPLDRALEQEQVSEFHQALLELTGQMKQCAVLRYRSDLKYAEIASLLGISMSSVRVQLWRARRRLKLLMRRQPPVSDSRWTSLGEKGLQAANNPLDELD